MVGQTALGNPSRRGDVHRAAAAQGIKEEEGGRQAVVHARRTYTSAWLGVMSKLRYFNVRLGEFVVCNCGQWTFGEFPWIHASSQHIIVYVLLFGATPKERKARWRRSSAVGDFEHILRDCTEMRFILCTWFGEFCSCCSLTVLPGPAWVLLNKICKD